MKRQWDVMNILASLQHVTAVMVRFGADPADPLGVYSVGSPNTSKYQNRVSPLFKSVCIVGGTERVCVLWGNWETSRKS